MEIAKHPKYIKIAPTTASTKLCLFSKISELNRRYGVLHEIRNANIVRNTIATELKNAQHFAPTKIEILLIN